jgi:hypothetical protein
MTIDGEKAPAFSAKTLSLPQPVDDLTPRIVELSRQRYAQDRIEIEKIIHQAATKLTAEKLASGSQPARPKAQHQLKQVETIEKTKPPADKPQDRATKAAAGLLRSVSNNDKPNHSAPSRRRRRRGRRKPQQHAGSTPAGQSTHKSQSKAEQEHVIKLR